MSVIQWEYCFVLYILFSFAPRDATRYWHQVRGRESVAAPELPLSKGQPFSNQPGFEMKGYQQSGGLCTGPRGPSLYFSIHASRTRQRFHFNYHSVYHHRHTSPCLIHPALELPLLATPPQQAVTYDRGQRPYRLLSRPI
jgi:hypothetical protein